MVAEGEDEDAELVAMAVEANGFGGSGGAVVVPVLAAGIEVAEEERTSDDLRW